MKKLFLLSAIAFCFTLQVNAQVLASMKNLTYPSTGTVDTVTNTGTGAVIIGPLTVPYSNLTIEPKVTKISGTMNSNSAPQLYGSLDGTIFYAITGDTLHITNTSSAITTLFIKTQEAYRYYKVQWTGTGTMSAKLEAKVFLVQH